MAETKVCTVCGEEKPLEAFHRRRHRTTDGRRTACKECTNKRNREENRRRSDPHKARVRVRTLAAVEAGLLTKEPCAVCGSLDVEAHHLSYDDEDSHLDVQWLCVEHHREAHSSAGDTKNRLSQMKLF